MSRVRVHNFTVSLDGFGTGDGQSYDAPFGHGPRIMEWLVNTSSFNAMHGRSGRGSNDVDDAFAAAWDDGVGIEIMGRHKFAPQPGPWLDDGWRGWWGEDAPFTTPCIVLTHHSREPITLEDGTVFHFLDAAPEAALARARELAPGTDVRIGGGATTLREFLEADLVDYLHVAIAPVLLGRGTRLWGDGLEALEDRFDDVRVTSSPSGTTHVEFERAAR